MEGQPKRRGFQFGIRAVFIAILLLSAVLTAYRLGFEHGRTLGPLIPATFSANVIHDRDYDITDIAKSKTDASVLIDSLKATAEPKSWDSTAADLLKSHSIPMRVCSPFLTSCVDMFRS